MGARFSALLISFQGSRALVRDESGNQFQCKLRQSARDTVTGDRVVVEQLESEAVIIEREPRATEFYRTDMRGKKKMIAANLDRLAIVIAPQPEPHLGLIDRYLAGAEISGLAAEIVINKVDLSGHSVLDEVRRIYPRIGYRVTEVSAKDTDSLGDLVAWAGGRSLAFLGQSGVGKSSLINALTGDQFLAEVGELSSKRAKGRHTTTSSYIYQMPFGGWIMDSPGIRDFENTQWQPHQVIAGFPELYQASLSCEFRNCRHEADRGCALIAGLEAGDIEPSRYESYKSIISLI